MMKMFSAPTRALVRRLEAFAALNSERGYQDAGMGNATRHANAPDRLLPGEIILCMEKCLADARAAWYGPDGGDACLPYIRKVGALAVQALENYGAPLREGFDGDGERVPTKGA
jgi:hypothetical protein